METVARRVMGVLAGRWRFERVITGFGRVEGCAQFSAMEGEGGLLYREDGTLVMEGSEQALPTTREYVYELRPEEPAGLFVQFAKGGQREGDFLHLVFDDGQDGWPATARGHHLCINDNYNAVLRVPGEQTFQLTYMVKGPRKDYEHRTVYTRA